MVSETDKAAAPHTTSVVPLLCLVGVVLLLCSVTPVIKYVFQHSHIQPVGLACFRVMIGFLFLLAITWLWDRRGLMSLSAADVLRLGIVGFLGVFSYAIAAWGLMDTSVVHYALIYSLLPSCTAALSVLFGHDRLTIVKCLGILLSLGGCVVAISFVAPDEEATIRWGDLFVLLFTVMMSMHIVVSSGIVKRFGVMVSNTVMFGSSSLLLLFGSMPWSGAFQQEAPPLIMLSVLYLGCATAAVFLLRCRALQSLSPATVGTYHNLVPVCTVLLAYFCLDEALGVSTIIGGLMVIVGAEVVRRPELCSLAALNWTKGAFAPLKTPRGRLLERIAEYYSSLDHLGVRGFESDQPEKHSEDTVEDA
jgi:drug/metabolite transporter (DMT)-like permease